MTNSPQSCSADIVEQLRTLVRHGRDQGMKMNEVEDAAREIERLRRVVSFKQRVERVTGDAQSVQVPKAWFCFVPSPPGEEEPLRIRAWTTDADRAKRIGEIIGREFEPLYASQPSPAATVETPPDWKQDQAETSRLPRQHLDASKWPSKAAMEASHARSSADTEDELGLYDLGESFLAEYERATKDGCLKNFVCAESPVEVLWHLINEADELRLEIDQLRQAAGETDRDAVAAIVLKAIQAKVDPDTYGASYAIKINADRAVIAADAILSLHRPEHNATNITQEH